MGHNVPLLSSAGIPVGKTRNKDNHGPRLSLIRFYVTFIGRRMGSPEDILSEISNTLETYGFETHPFKIGWYNDMVQPLFRFGYSYDTLAVIVISTPAMYEKAFKPFISRQECVTGIRDPIDECVDHHIKQLKQILTEHDIEVLHDFDKHPTNRPKVLVQTAGHAAGAAYYYQRSDMTNDPWDPKQKIHGVSIHPEYGGWFALRCVLIFKDVLHQNLARRIPPNILDTDELKKEVLERFNFHWQDWTFRDIIPVKDRYSEEQKIYFNTAPAERKALLAKSKN